MLAVAVKKPAAAEAAASLLAVDPKPATVPAPAAEAAPGTTTFYAIKHIAGPFLFQSWQVEIDDATGIPVGAPTSISKQDHHGVLSEQMRDMIIQQAIAQRSRPKVK